MGVGRKISGETSIFKLLWGGNADGVMLIGIGIFILFLRRDLTGER